MIPKNTQNRSNERFEQTTLKSSLPSRSEIHRKKKKKHKAKIKFPLIKLLVLFFILLPIGFYFVYSYFQDQPVYNQKPSESSNKWGISIKRDL